MFYTVYKTTNNTNGRIYIGVHKTDDPEDNYLGSGYILKKAINKYGIDNFTKEILACFDNPEDMFNMESELVNEEFVGKSTTYNAKIGGNGGWDHVSSKGTVVIRDSTGKCFRVPVDDPRYLSGELKSPSIGKVPVKDKNGKVFTVNNNDPRYLSGELVYQHTGHKFWLGKNHTDDSKKKIGEANSKHQKGKGNSQYGTIWVYCPYTHENRKITKFDLTQWEKDGWVKGRKIKQIYGSVIQQ